MPVAVRWCPAKSSLRRAFALVWLATVFAQAAPARGQFPITEDFQGTTAPGWVLGANAQLTAAAGIDPDGQGWLRLTPASSNRRGFAYFDTPLPATQGISVEFEYAMWGGSVQGADGISFFLFDGATSPFVMGGFGGSLGYAQLETTPGMTGGYFAVGFDAFGNWSAGTEGRVGGRGFTQNAIAIRGPGSGLSGYAYLGGSATLNPGLATGSSRPPSPTDPTYRRVFIDLVPQAGGYLITVRLQRGTSVAPILFQVPITNPPPTLKFGFAAATGGQYNNHEVRLVSVTQPLDLRLTKTVLERVGTAIGYRLTASNAGPNTDPLAHIVDPLGSLTNVSWSCVGADGGVCAMPAGSGPLDTTASLPDGGSVTYEVHGTITDLATSPLVNTATVSASASFADLVPANNTATASLPLPTDIQVTKTAPAAYTPGAPFRYQIEVRNLGLFTVRGVGVTDDVPGGLPAVWSCQIVTPPALCNTSVTSRPFQDTADLGAGAVIRYALDVIVPPGQASAMTNTVRVTVPEGWQDDPQDNTASVTTPAAPRADLSVSKSSAPNPYVIGQPLTFTIVVTNTGPSDVVGAHVQDRFQASYVDATWTCAPSHGGACGATSGTGDLDQLVSLPVGGSVTYTVVVAIELGLANPLENTVTVTPPAGVTDPAPGNNTAIDLNPAYPLTDLAITKSATPDPFLQGQPFTYYVIVSNRGPSPAVDARVQDVLPAGVAASATWTCVVTPTGSCGTAAGVGSIDALVTLPVGSAATFTITGVVAIGTEALVNTASVTLPGTIVDLVPGNNTATVSTAAAITADLRIEKSSTPDPYEPGGPIMYVLDVHNDGPDAAANARVVDMFPAGVTDVTWTCTSATGGCATAAGSGHIDALVTLPAGGTTTFTVSATAPPNTAAALVNVATVSPPADVVDPVPGNNEASDTNPSVATVNLAVTKTATPAPYRPGQPLAYTITVSNAGPASAVGARVQDTLPRALAGFTWTCTGISGGATCGTPQGSGAIDALVTLPAAGASVQFVLSGVVGSGVTGPLTNVATVTPPLGEVDPQPGDNIAITTIVSAPLPDLGIVLTAVPVSTYQPRGRLAYRLVVTNHGTAAVSAAGYGIADVLPEPLTGVTWTCTASPQVACGVAGGVLHTGPLPRLAPNATLTLTLQPVVPANVFVPLRNEASVSITAPGVVDPNSANNSSTVWLLASLEDAAVITGRVVDGDGAPLEGVTIRVEGATSLETTTDADGIYGFPGLTPGHHYDVVASLPGYVFTPPAHVFEALTGIARGDFVGIIEPYRRYYSEGATGAFFTTTYSLTNPGRSAADVRLRFQRPEGSEIAFSLMVPPQQNVRLDPSTIPGLEATAFSTVIESPQQIFSAREMHWDRNDYGTHRGIGVGMPRTHWVIAEGATLPRFSLFYLLQNPGDAVATVTIRYLLQAEGATPVVRSYLVAPRSRYTIGVHDDPALAHQELSAEIDSDVPIVVERAMYFSGPRLFEAGTVVTAVPAPSSTWYFAEGATGAFFEMFLLLANPNAVDVMATVRYVLPDGGSLTRQYAVPAGTRRTVWVDLADPLLADTAVGMVVEATTPIVAERAMWWPGVSETWSAGHASAGSTTVATRWGIGGLQAGGEAHAEPWVLVTNPFTAATRVRLTLLFQDGRTPVTADYEVAAESRLTIAVGQWHPETANASFGAIVEQLDATTGIVVESAVYFDSQGVVWAAGDGGIATPIP